MPAANALARPLILAAALLLSAPFALSQTPPSAPVPSRFLYAVDKAVGGQRVFVVNSVGLVGRNGGLPPLEGRDTLARLQDICEEFSGPNMTVIPYAVRGTWVLAPQTRNAEPPDLARRDPLDYMGRLALIQKALAQLPPERWAALGSEKGLSASTFPPEAKGWLAQALRPPLNLSNRYYQGDTTMEDAGPTITDQFNLGAVRLRAQLRSGGIVCRPPVEPGRTARPEWRSGSGVSGKRLLVFSDSGADWGWHNSDNPPAFLTVPNTFKPSDLDGKAYTQPLGMSGMTTVAAVAAQIAKLTHLSLAVSPQYRSLMAYVGSPSVTCGEALDGLRLGLTASWRKLGKTYLLAWDREGLAVVMARMQAASKPAIERAQQDVSRAIYSDAWRGLAASLPFAADDSFAWTDAQRKTLLTTPPPVRWGESSDFFMPTKLPYNEMTAAQQEKAHALLAGLEESRRRDAAWRAERGYREETGPGVSDVASAFLCGTAQVELSIELPGAGWAAIENPVYTLKAKEPQRLPSPSPPFPTLPPGAPRPVIPPTPLVKADDRGVAVPPLSAAELAPVLKAMHDKGFKTLYYPALIDGYATFPTAAFPPHPALKGANGWAAAVKAARAAGLSVVATVNALVWRPPTKEPHWMDDRPDLIDRDLMGRPLLAAWEAADAHLNESAELRGDLVSPTPEALRKLIALLDSLGAQPAPDGVFIDAWSPATAIAGESSRDVHLGYGLAARVVCLAEQGYDPVDVCSEYPRNPPHDPVALFRPGKTMGFDTYGHLITRSLTPETGPPVLPPDANVNLLKALLDDTEAKHPRWTRMINSHISVLSMYQTQPPPTADLALEPSGMGMGSRTDAWIHVPSEAALSRWPGEHRPYSASRKLRVAEETSWWQRREGLKRVVYDFRDAPEGIAAAVREAVLD